MIAREGYVPLGLTLLLAAGFGFSGAWLPGGAAVGASVLLFWLYLEGRRQVPAAPRGILAPVDGLVRHVEPSGNPWLEGEMLRISVSVSPPGIKLLHSVVEGKIKDLWTRYGPFGESQLKRSLDASPDCYALWVQTDDGDDVIVAVSSRWPVSRCRFDKSPGERLGHGNRFGFVYFGSSVDVLVPPDSTARVAVGDRVRAAESILAELNPD
ncbi:MAG: phosphatidylserine decarboxylase [Gammaproteobacteria bacterium]|nr:phosphatidylserine decarboxylase [Gammaproteobacteria bacterium]